MDLAVLEFGTIGSVDGWEALGSSHHAQHAQHRHSLSSHREANISTRACAFQCFSVYALLITYWLTWTVDVYARSDISVTFLFS